MGHDVRTVHGLGWAGLKNGELLKRAGGTFDAFVTMDRRLGHQHDLSVLSFGVILVHARSNRVQELEPLIGSLLKALSRIGPGQLEHVGT